MIFKRETFYEIDKASIAKASIEKKERKKGYITIPFQKLVLLILYRT